jgi:DNA adenine methylase
MQTSTFGVDNKSVSYYPFVKWAGGKNQLLARLQQFIPSEFTTYIEPFVGGGALFFDLASKKKFNATLSDINEELINAYQIIKNHVDELIGILQISQKEYQSHVKLSCQG